MLSRYRAFLAVPGFPRLLISSVLGRMPLGMSSLAVLLLIREQTGSFAIAGLAVGAYTLGGAALAPVQGALIDRYGQPRVLWPCACGQGALLVAIVVAAREEAPEVVLVVLAALAGILLPPISACARALWREATPDPAGREAAYTLDAISQEFIWTLGPLLVAAAVAAFSPAAAVLLCAGITLGGTALFASSELSRRWRGTGSPRSRAGALASPGLRALLTTIALTGLGAGAVQVGLPALAVHVGSPAASGVLLALWSVGSLVGGLYYGARIWRLSVDARYRALLGLLALSTAPLIAASSLPAGVVLSLIAGIAYAPLLACQYALVGALAPRGTTTEAFTWSTAAFVGGISAGAALAGWLAETTGVGACFALGCLAAALAGVLAVVRRRRFELAGSSAD